MIKKWNIKIHDHDAARSFARSIDVSPLAAALLIARGFETPEKAKKFLSPSFEDLHSPYLLRGLDRAVKRILDAVDSGEKILIWGDYDVDGTTGTALLRGVLALLGGITDYHIPNRFTEGYGLNIPALDDARNKGFSLVITVDCGIRAFVALQWAKENQLDVIVTDHHLSDGILGNPPAFAVVNPNQPECPYPDKHLAGVGVAFKLAHALLIERGLEDHISQFLKITAIGTVADIMKLTGENRAIVSLGLRDLTNTTNYGLRALMDVSDCTSDMTSTHIGFRIAPRINAAGRMDVARDVVELLQTTDRDEATRIAALLDSRNRERRRVQQEITENALLEADRLLSGGFVVVAGDGWHRGVIGLAASQLAERLCRPTIVFSIENGIAHGSARSFGGFHLLDALDSCAELFEQYGGHAAAAGMSARSDAISAIRTRLGEYVKANFEDTYFEPQLNIDARISPSSLTTDLVKEVSRFEPFGAGNNKPIFVTRGLFIDGGLNVMKTRHLKLWLKDGAGRQFEAVWWDGVERSKGQTLEANSGIEVAYTAEINSWQGKERLQLVVEDIRADN